MKLCYEVLQRILYYQKYHPKYMTMYGKNNKLPISLLFTDKTYN